LEKELGHINNAIDMMVRQEDLSPISINMSEAKKSASIKKWLHHQE